MGITWTKTDNDYTAKVGEYSLTACRFTGVWFWKVHLRYPTIADGFAPNLEQAKEAAEKAYNEHLKKEK